jgi:hypothetical protein
MGNNKTNNWPTELNNCYCGLLKCEMPNNFRKKILSGDQTAVLCTNWRHSYFSCYRIFLCVKNTDPRCPVTEYYSNCNRDVKNVHTPDFPKHEVHLNYIVYLKIQFLPNNRLGTVNLHFMIKRLILFRELTPLQYEHHTNDIHTFWVNKVFF